MPQTDFVHRKRLHSGAAAGPLLLLCDGNPPLGVAWSGDRDRQLLLGEVAGWEAGKIRGQGRHLDNISATHPQARPKQPHPGKKQASYHAFTEIVSSAHVDSLRQY
jgi:hypothetical protein